MHRVNDGTVPDCISSFPGPSTQDPLKWVAVRRMQHATGIEESHWKLLEEQCLPLAARSIYSCRNLLWP
jgi:hypothetical protein